MCNTYFNVILAEQSISCIIYMTECHLQGENVNLEVKWAKKYFFLTNN